MGATITMKVGDTLQSVSTYRDANGTPVDLTAAGIEVASSVLSPDGATRHELIVELADQATDPGKYTIKGDSSDWPPGKGWRWDVRYTLTSTEFSWSTDTQLIDLKERIS